MLYLLQFNLTSLDVCVYRLMKCIKLGFKECVINCKCTQIRMELGEHFKLDLCFSLYFSHLTHTLFLSTYTRAYQKSIVLEIDRNKEIPLHCQKSLHSKKFQQLSIYVCHIYLFIYIQPLSIISSVLLRASVLLIVAVGDQSKRRGHYSNQFSAQILNVIQIKHRRIKKNGETERRRSKKQVTSLQQQVSYSSFN